MAEGRFFYDRETDRYQLVNLEGDLIHDLHCGEPLEIWNGTEWVPTRIELDGSDWYLVGTGYGDQQRNLGGLRVRIPE